MCVWTFDEGGGDVSLQSWDLGGASAADSVAVAVGPNVAPVATILSPTETGVCYSDQLMTFEGQMSDMEDQPSDLIGRWESSLDGVLTLNEVPDASGIVLDFTTLSEGSHAITFTATDLGGKTGTDSVIVEVGPPNSAPNCQIVTPVNGDAAELGASVAFTGVVSEADISPDQLDISWTSDTDGHLADSLATSAGDVSFVTTSLSTAIHTVTLSVSDELGATCSDSVTFTVGSPPSVVITEPSNGNSSETGQIVRFKAEVNDAEDVATDLALVWSSTAMVC